MGQFTVYIDIVSNKYITSSTIINSYNNYNIITQLLLQKKKLIMVELYRALTLGSGA